MNDPISEMGIATMMITVARHLPKKKSTMTPTIINAKKMVSSKLLMEVLI